MILLLRVLIALTWVPFWGAFLVFILHPGWAAIFLLWVAVGTLSWLAFELGQQDRGRPPSP